MYHGQRSTMDQMQQASISHLVQVYQPTASTPKIQNPQIIHISHPSLPTSQGKVTYQQTITSESITIPVTEIQGQQLQMSQNQIVMSCQQGLQGLQPLQSQAQVVQSNMSQPLITSHVILPQHVLVNGVPSYYNQYGYPKEQCILTKLEPELSIGEENVLQGEKTAQPASDHSPKKRSRRQYRDPTLWACNLRKIKHQRGEAYISRRGKYVPEKQIKNTKDCVDTCKYKCSKRISDTDREHIFKSFYSLNANDKKHFLLNTTDRLFIRNGKPSIKQKRKYIFKYFFSIRSEKLAVCKDFYLGTLAISQKPVYNVHKGKSDLNMPKPDGRGHSEASVHSIACEVKDRVRKHILTYRTVDNKPVVQFSKKKQYLDPKLCAKQMYNTYYSECNKDSVIPVKESMYRKIFKQEFNLHFRKVKSDQQLCGRCKTLIKKK